MATVIRGDDREQPAHFGLYRTSVGGDEGIIVRRKVGEPTDYDHTRSRKLQRSRDNLAVASQAYAKLSPSQKALGRHEFEEVEYIRSHGQSDTKLLMGRQLFISKEIHSLNTTSKKLLLPHEVCIMLVDPALSPIAGELWLSYLKDGDWHDIAKEELATGSWLFTQVPTGQEAYRAYGEADGFHDPLDPDHQFMSENYLLTHHYQVLYPSTGGDVYSFGARYWNMNMKRDAHTIFSKIHIKSELTMFDFTGTLTIAIWKSGYPFPLIDKLASQDYSISSVDPDPKILYTTLEHLPIQQGLNYWIRHMKSIQETDLWEGIIRHWEY